MSQKDDAPGGDGRAGAEDETSAAILPESLALAARRLKLASAAKTPRARLRHLQAAHDRVALAEASLRSEIGRLAGELLLGAEPPA